MTYRDVCPPHDDLGLFAEQERVETHVVDAAVEPALTRHAALPVAA